MSRAATILYNLSEKYTQVLGPNERTPEDALEQYGYRKIKSRSSASQSAYKHRNGSSAVVEYGANREVTGVRHSSRKNRINNIMQLTGILGRE